MRFNLIIAPLKRHERLVIQKLHVDHMYGPGNEVVVAIDFSGAALRSRYFTGSHDSKPFPWGFNRRLNRGRGGLRVATSRGWHAATRVADMLVHAMAADKDVHYAKHSKTV